MERLRGEISRQESLLRSLGPTLKDGGAKVRACISNLRSQLPQAETGRHCCSWPSIVLKCFLP